MKKLLFIISFLLCAFVSFSQYPNKVRISNNQTIYSPPVLKADSSFMLSIKDTLNNQSTFYPGALTVRPTDTIGYGNPPVYMSNGRFWNRLTSLFIIRPGVDSITLYGNQLCEWRQDTATCYFLTPSTGGAVDSFHLNYDSTYILQYRNGALHDSIFLLHTKLYVDPAHFSLTTNYLSPYGVLLEGTYLVDSVYASPFGTGYNYYRYANGDIDSLAAGSVVSGTITWSVLDSLSTPVILPREGSIYLVGTSPTGQFATHANEIATRDSVAATYSFQSATIGDLLYNANNGMVSQWTGTAWIWVSRLLIHQGGDFNYLPTVAIGSKDSVEVQLLQNNVPRLTINRTDKDIYIANGTNISLYGVSGTPSGLIAFGDLNNSIYDDGGGKMIFNEFVGTSEFRNGTTGKHASISRYGNDFYARTKIGNLGDASPNALLDLQSDTTALILPRMTAVQRIYSSSDVNTGSISAAGSGYPNGTNFNIPLTGGSGTGATAHLTVTGNAVTGFLISTRGRNYVAGDVLAANFGGGTGFTYTLATTGTPAMIVFDTDSLSTFQWTGTAWQNLYNTGGGGGGEDMQQTFDINPTANPTINAHNNSFVLDSTNSFYTTSRNYFYLDSRNDTANVRISGETQGEPILFQQATDVTTGGHAYTNLFTNTGRTFQFENITDEISTNTKVVILNADTLLTPPTYVYVPDADTMKVYPFPAGGGGGITALSAIGSTPNANAATITGSTLNLEPASASFGGVVTTGTQTFAGAKTFGALTGTTFNGNTFTAGTGTLTIAAGKTLTASNTLTFAGTDGSTLNIGTGGTLGTNAYTSTAYLPLAGADYATTTGNGLALTSSTLTTGKLMSIGITGTAAASNTKGALSITSSGANATASQTVTGQTISVTNTGTTNTNVGLNVTASGATNNYAALFDGNVGIGTTTPTKGLYVKTNSDGQMRLDANSGQTYTTMYLANNGTDKVVLAWNNAAAEFELSGLVTGDYIIKTNNGERLRIKALGNIGIGVTSPTAVLHLKAGGTAVNTAPEKNTAGSLLTTIEALTTEVNASSFYRSTVALNRYAEGGVIADFTADVNNSGTGETDLLTYTTKANTLVATGEKLIFNCTGTFNDLTATSQLQFYFGGTNIGNSGALTVSATGGWTATVTIIRTGSTTARSTVNLSTPGASTAVYTTETDITGLTLSNTNIIKITGTAGGASGGSSDITAKMGYIMWWGAANN